MLETNIILVAFLFSFIAGISTALGSLVAFFIKDLKHSYLSLFMGFSAGVMIQISFMELLFSAIIDAGFPFSNIAFFVGALTIALIDFLIPHEYEEEHDSTEEKNRRSRLAKTGMLTSLGIAIHNFPEGLVTLFGTIKDRAHRCHLILHSSSFQLLHRWCQKLGDVYSNTKRDNTQLNDNGQLSSSTIMGV